MESFKSPGSTSSPGLSPAHQQLTSDGKTALMPSPEEQATLPTPPPPPSAATPSHDAAANATSQSSIPPPPPMPTDVTGSPIPDLSRNDRQKSFLHAAKNSDSTAPAESSSNIPPPPPLWDRLYCIVKEQTQETAIVILPDTTHRASAPKALVFQNWTSLAGTTTLFNLHRSTTDRMQTLQNCEEPLTFSRSLHVMQLILEAKVVKRVSKSAR